MKLIFAVVLSLLPLPGFAQNQNSTDWRKELKSDTTLGTVRQLFLNQKVVVTGTVISGGLLEWQMAHKGTAGRYTIEILNNLWSLYKGQRATVLAVQLNESALRRVRPNALGEIVAEDNIVNPYFDIVVQFGDETLAACTAYPPILKDLGDRTFICCE